MDLLPDRCNPACGSQQDKSLAEIPLLVAPDKDSRLHTNMEQCWASLQNWNQGEYFLIGLAALGAIAFVPQTIRRNLHREQDAMPSSQGAG